MRKEGLFIRNHFRRIGRDNMLILLLVYPILLAVVARFLVPVIRQATLTPQFDLVAHYPAILIFFVVLNPFLYGDLLAFTLLDDREQGTIHVIRILPVGIRRYLLVQIVLFMIISILGGMFVIATVPLYPITVIESLLINVASSFGVPFSMLLVNLLSKNKVEGFAIVKSTGFLMIFPVAALYTPVPFDKLFAVSPAYFPGMALDKLANSTAGLVEILPILFVGVVYTLLLSVVLYHFMYKRLN